MMIRKLKRIFTSVRVIVLLVFLLIAFLAIHPNPYVEGVSIRNVVKNSSASVSGIVSPDPKLAPMSKERIVALEIQRKKVDIKDVKDYYDAIDNLEVNDTLKVFTDRADYLLKVMPLTETIITNELVAKEELITKEIVEEINGTNVTRTEYVTEYVRMLENVTKIDNETNETVVAEEIVTKLVNKTKTVFVNKTETNILGVQDLGLTVYNAPTNNLRKGLDLQGGTRVLLEPEEVLSSDDMDILKSNMERRLNIYGLSDISVRIVKDKPGFLGGVPRFILVEIPGANEIEVKELLSKQGKFEALIGNNTVFRGGQDITYVCRSADCSGIDPYKGCEKILGGDGWGCSFMFQIALSPDAARKFSDSTKDLEVVTNEEGGEYLSEQIELLLDNELVDALNIGASLQGRVETDIQISGSAVGATQQEAMFEALANMKELQTVLITGSLPVKLNIRKTDNISPVLGSKFVDNAILVGILSLLTVAVIIFIRYRNLNVAIPTVIIMSSEAFMLLGFAAFVGWNLDLAAIAGIIVALGTGVDDLVVICDETLRGEQRIINWKQKLKNAFFIITGAYLTTVFAMFPLWFAGAGLLKGFAFTTIAGVSLGVLVARPAYAKIIEELLRE